MSVYALENRHAQSALLSSFIGAFHFAPFAMASLSSSLARTLLKRGSPPRPAGDVMMSPAPRLIASAQREATAAKRSENA